MVSAGKCHVRRYKNTSIGGGNEQRIRKGNPQKRDGY